MSDTKPDAFLDSEGMRWRPLFRGQDGEWLFGVDDYCVVGTRDWIVRRWGLTEMNAGRDPLKLDLANEREAHTATRDGKDCE